MTAKLAIDNNLVTTDSLILSLGTTAAFAFVSAAIIELCGLLPKMVFRILLLILNTLGAAAFAAAYLYGTAMTPDMVRNFLATDPAEAQAYLSTRSVLLFLAAWLPPMLVTLAAKSKEILPALLARRSCARLAYIPSPALYLHWICSCGRCAHRSQLPGFRRRDEKRQVTALHDRAG